MHLTKHHGLGNDFLVALVDEVPRGGADLARSWCHRRHGVGADGLIFGTPGTDTDLVMTLFNSDGSGAEVSGNGLRCLAQAAFAHTESRSLRVATGGGVRQLEMIRPGPPEALISVEMGQVEEGPAMVDLDALPPFDFEIGRAATASIGNPHVVFEVDDLTRVRADRDGPAAEALWKPDGINVHFLAHRGPSSVQLVHWERGAGVTQACGSGASVAAALAQRWGMVSDRVEVVMPGGIAEVVIAGSAATLVGPAVFVAEIDIEFTSGAPSEGVARVGVTNG